MAGDEPLRGDVFTFVDSMVPVPADLGPLFAATWDDLAAPGMAWSGRERVDIAAVARAARRREPSPEVPLPPAAIEASQRVAAEPSTLSQEVVHRLVDALGELRYVELVGVVATLAAVDTFTQLVGDGITPLPQAVPGEPTPPGTIDGLKRRSAWVSMAGPPRPRFSLSAAPLSQTTFNRLLDRLYMDREELHGTGPVRGLSRSQMELVILSVSHSNECFY